MSFRSWERRVVFRRPVLEARLSLLFQECCQQGRPRVLLQLQSASALSTRARGGLHTGRCTLPSLHVMYHGTPIFLDCCWDSEITWSGHASDNQKGICLQAVRDNGRIATTDAAYAEHLWQALGLQSALAGLTVDGRHACSLNPNIRLYRSTSAVASCHDRHILAQTLLERLMHPGNAALPTPASHSQ